jgi:hypothetical protein
MGNLMLCSGDGVTLKRDRQKAVVIRLINPWGYLPVKLFRETLVLVRYRSKRGTVVHETFELGEIINAGPEGGI